MSAVTPTNATVSASGIVTFEYDGVLRAQPGSEIAAAVLTGQITETQIADNAISTPKLQAGSVITAKLAAAAVTAGIIAAEAVETGKLRAGAVTAEKIAVSELSAISANIGTVTAGVIQGPTIRTGTVGARVQLASSGLQAFNAGGAEVLSFSTATGNLFVKGEIKAGSTVPATTITGTLTDAQIAEIAAAKITGTIAETQIGNETISTAKLQAASVSTAKLAAAAVTAEKIAVAELSAISANIGTVTAGTIKGVNIEALNKFTLPEATVTKEAKSSLQWVEGATIRSYISGWNLTSAHFLEAFTETAEAHYGKLRLGSTVEGNQLAELNAKYGTQSAFLQALVTETEARLRANTGTAEATILDQAGKSSFPQFASKAKRLIYSGAVSSAGAVLNGTGFTSTRTAKGKYTVKLSTPLSSVGSLFLELNGAFTQVHKTTGPSTTEWSIEINGFNFAVPALEAADEAFSFFIIQH